jgi:hypothetical protein
MAHIFFHSEIFFIEPIQTFMIAIFIDICLVTFLKMNI